MTFTKRPGFGREASNEVYVTKENAQRIFQEDLSSSTFYIITEGIDLGSTTINVPSGGLSMSGYTFDLSGLTSSVDGHTLFSSTAAGNVLLTDLFLSVTGSGSQVFDLKSNTGFDAFEIARVNFNDCVSLGTLDNYRQGLETGTGRFGGTPELTLKGVWVGGFFIETSIVRSLDDGAYSLYKAGTGFSMASRFRSNQNIDLPASASFLDFAPSNFTNPSTLQLTGCIISREGSFDSSDTNITPNVDKTDLISSWDSNVGVGNTFEGGLQTITSEATTTISVQGDLYAIAGTWTVSELEHFESVANGGLKHLGSNPEDYWLDASLVLESTAGDDVKVHVVVYDDSAASESVVATSERVINSMPGSRDVAFFDFRTSVNLDKDDYMYLKISNESGTADITVELDGLLRLSER